MCTNIAISQKFHLQPFAWMRKPPTIGPTHGPIVGPIIQTINVNVSVSSEVSERNRNTE